MDIFRDDLESVGTWSKVGNRCYVYTASANCLVAGHPPTSADDFSNVAFVGNFNSHFKFGLPDFDRAIRIKYRMFHRNIGRRWFTMNLNRFACGFTCSVSCYDGKGVVAFVEQNAVLEMTY